MTFAQKLKQLRWYQWLLLAVVFVYLLYIALSYLYLPNKLKQVVETDVADMLGRELSVAPVEFNPFDLSVRVNAFSIADKPDAPLLAWQSFYLNFTPWGSLFAWDIMFEEIQLDQPVVNIEKRGDEFNFTDILERLASQEPEQTEPPEESTKLALEIMLTAINGGYFRFIDYSGEEPAETEMEDVSIEVKDIYLATGDDHLNPFNIKASVPGGGVLHLQGEYRIDPLHVEAQVEAKGVQLKEYSAFVSNVAPVKISDGVLALSTHVLLEQGEEFEMKLNQGSVSVLDFALDDKVANPAMLRINSINVNDLNLDLLKQDLVIGEVALDGILANQWLDKNGNLRIQALLVNEVVDQNVQIAEQEKAQQAAAEEESAPWNMLVKKVSYKNGTINFTDQNENITRDHSVSDISIDLQNLTLTENKEVPISVSALLDDSGKINVDGVMTLVPFSMDLKYLFDGIQLAPFSEYAELASFVRIEKGGITINGDMQLSTEGEVPISSTLGLEINEFQAEDMRTGKPIINFQQIKISEASLDTQSKLFNMKSLLLAGPDLKLIRSKEGELNWATLAKTEDVEEAVEESAEQMAEQVADDATQTHEWHYAIGEVKLEKGDIRFQDRSVSPQFKTELNNLMVTVGEVSSQRSEPTPFSLETKIDKYAPFQIKGKLDPPAKQPGFEFTSKLNGLEMHRLSPYSAQYIGHNLESGKLNLDLNYQLHDSKLKGENGIVAKNLYLGSKVPSEDAIDAPVGLGLALLRDVNGVIDLDVGVSGDLDDPGFSVSGIIVKAFVNIIVKAASSPFSLLGSLVGGREDLGEIEFDAGMADLNEGNLERLQQLVEALQQRPQLAIHITGNAIEAQDKAVLQQLMIQDVVAEERKMSLVELREEAGETDWWTVRANRKELGKINKALGLPSVSDREKQIKTTTPDISSDQLEEQVYKAMYADVWAQQPIDQTDLLALADRRALAIKQHLVDVLNFDFSRVSVTKTKAADLSGRVINMEIEAK